MVEGEHPGILCIWHNDPSSNKPQFEKCQSEPEHKKDGLNDAMQNQNLEYEYPMSPWRKEVLDFGAHDNVEFTAQIEHTWHIKAYCLKKQA